jgi:hypothetical protein
MQLGAGGVMMYNMNKDDVKNGCRCGAMSMLRMIAEITRGENCIVKCP